MKTMAQVIDEALTLLLRDIDSSPSTLTVSNSIGADWQSPFETIETRNLSGDDLLKPAIVSFASISKRNGGHHD